MIVAKTTKKITRKVKSSKVMHNAITKPDMDNNRAMVKVKTEIPMTLIFPHMVQTANKPNTFTISSITKPSILAGITTPCLTKTWARKISTEVKLVSR